jgi:3-hydroxybutyryl-CoA dehydrogenase
MGKDTPMQLNDIKKVLILGAGTMGQQIGFVCALHGYDVVMHDLSEDILTMALKNMEKLGASWFVPQGRITSAQLDEIMARIHAAADPQKAARDADIISESVPEDPALKARVFARFHELCPERTIFTTNASLLLPSEFAQDSGRPGKLLALHFHDVRTTSIVDVMPHPGTLPEVTQLVIDFVQSIGQVPILLKHENSGYVFNAMISTLFLSALSLAARDVAGIADIDRAWMGITRMSVGPFGMMDQVGLKTVWTITDYWAKKTKNKQSQANADFIKQYVERGELGFKTKKGFYSYPDPEYAGPDFLTHGIDDK